jgi:hypothetical protein
MRIGTWNLDGGWTPAHLAELLAADCELWLLTEIRTDVHIDGYAVIRSPATMTRGQHFAAIFSRSGLDELEAPHPASALARVDGVTCCASVLPWPSAPRGDPWIDGSTADRTEAAVEAIVSRLEGHVVWGGDWNHPVAGSDSGYYHGREFTLAAAGMLGLQIPTADLPGRHLPARSIDHIAVPISWHLRSKEHRTVNASLSDHDVYVVEVDAPPANAPYFSPEGG